MIYPKGIEGDYIETKENNLFFDVKGVLHPKDRKICFLRFYPDPKGDRIKNGVRFKKIYDLKKRYSYLRDHFQKYIFYSQELDLELQGVINEDIKKIYTPRDYLRSLNEKSGLSKIKKYSKELCDLFVNKGKIPENSIGITGSQMVGLEKDNSDIDLIIYGTEASLNFQGKLKKILEKSNICRKYDLEDFQKHYQWRVGGSDISFEDFIKSEKKKLHQGKFRGIDFFIRYVKSPEDWRGNFYDFEYENCGRIKLKAKIKDSIDSIFTPSSYKIGIIKILNQNLISNQINVKKIREINSFRGRFCEHARKGDIVLVEGKLEKVIIQNSEEYFRILLGDQVLDRMIILNK